MLGFFTVDAGPNPCIVQEDTAFYNVRVGQTESIAASYAAEDRIRAAGSGAEAALLFAIRYLTQGRGCGHSSFLE